MQDLSQEQIKKSQLTTPSTRPMGINKSGGVIGTKITNIQSEAALIWFEFGFEVIPIIPGTKRTAVKWDVWLNDLSLAKITQHWAKHSDHEIGFIIGDGLIVFDADSPESVAALAVLETKSGIESKLVVKTSKGKHLYYRRAKDTNAKTDTHGTEEHPERIDVKTGRTMVILPPSTGKTILIGIAINVSELTEVNQDFIDAVFQHNGRKPPRQLELTAVPRVHSEPQDVVLSKLKALLEHIDANCGYEDWLHVLMAVYHETGGSDDGLELVSAWSSKGKKYKGKSEIIAKWHSFRSDTNNPITIATLCKMVKDSGKDWKAACDTVISEFKVLDVETEVINPSEPSKVGHILISNNETPKNEQNTIGRLPVIPSTDAEVIASLAAMSPMEYDRIRLEKAKELGVQVKTLDAQVKELRDKKTGDDNLLFPEIEPYPEPTVLALLLDEISEIICRFVIVDKNQADTAALWIAHTYLINIFDISPIAIINAPEKACAKTLFQTLLARMAFRALPAANASVSALFRAVELWKPTIFFDEADTFFRNNFELQGLVNGGYKRGGYVLRSESTGESYEPRRFSVYSAKSIAGISLEKHLPDSTMSRGIIFNMRRKLPHESVMRMRHAESRMFEIIVSKLTRFAMDFAQQVRLAQPKLPDALSDRDQDNWEALLAIAECAGPEWLNRATAAALDLSNTGEAHTSSGNELLADIRHIFNSGERPRKISTVDLIKALIANDESPWATYNFGKSITPRQLAKLLTGYGIKSKTVRLGHANTPKGYDADQFSDVFARYLPQKLPQQRNESAVPNNNELGGAADNPPHDCIHNDSATLNALLGLDCGVGADKSGDTSETTDEY